MENFLPSLFPPMKAGSIRELATALKLDPTTLEETVSAFNRSVRPGRFDPSILDECATDGLELPKTHWARPIDTPPFLRLPAPPRIRRFVSSGSVTERFSRPS